MSLLKNLKSVPFEIANLLGTTNSIVQLIYDDTPDALEHVVNVSFDQLLENKYISFYPLTETGMKDIHRNTFIVINAEDFNLYERDNNKSLDGNIYISTDEEHYLLSNNRLRLLELIDNIVNTLNNIKLSSAGLLEIHDINYVVFSDFRVGYRISFSIQDQPNRKAEL